MAEESLQEQGDRLDSLGITFTTDFTTFLRYAAMAFANPKKHWVDSAFEKLDKIEDSIKRFREGRPQSFEETSHD